MSALPPYRRVNGSGFSRISLKITRAGEVVVTAPKLLPQFLLDQFVASKSDWLSAKLAEFQARRPAPLKPDQLPSSVQIFGKAVPIIILEDATQPPGIKLTPQAVTLNFWELPKKTALKQKVTTQLNALLKRTAEQYLTKRTTDLAKIMHIKFARLSLREQQSRWGSCSSQGNLNFNWRLVHHPPAIIDYVIIHELAHRREMNHSAAFWQIVAQYDPAYNLHKGWLKRHGETVL
jgi:hypothetical protein